MKGKRLNVEEARRKIVEKLQTQACREIRIPREHLRAVIGGFNFWTNHSLRKSYYTEMSLWNINYTGFRQSYNRSMNHIERYLSQWWLILITPSHFMIQSIQQVWSTPKLPNLCESSFGGGLASAASPIVRSSAKEAGDHRPPSQSGFRQIWRRRRRPNPWPDWITRLTYSITYFNALCKMIYLPRFLFPDVSRPVLYWLIRGTMGISPTKFPSNSNNSNNAVAI